MEPRSRVHLLARLAVAAAALLGSAAADARVLLSQKEALALAFPHGAPERRTAFLTEAQAREAQADARSKLESPLWTFYAGKAPGDEGVTAYFETHHVRTMDETFMVVVGPDAKVKFVEILAFAEPEDFLAPPRWLKQFDGRPLDDELALRRGLRNITGATLTAEAVSQGVRRVLAVHRVLHPAPLAAK